MAALCGQHDTGFMAELSAEIKERFQKAPTSEFRNIFKSAISRLSKNQFDKFKLLGMYSKKKNPAEVSRGYMKLEDILLRTKLRPSGNILSLACGRGGWEQCLGTKYGNVHGTSITLGPNLGTEGHEGISGKPWPCKENFMMAYGDITKIWEKGYMLDYQGMPYPSRGVFECDWVLFDGGESKPDPRKEADGFYSLFEKGVMPAFRTSPPREGFILKVLTPDDPRVQALLREIQDITGKGDLLRCSYSRHSNVEMYFVSTAVRSVPTRARALMTDQADRALLGTMGVAKRTEDKVDLSVRSPVSEVEGLEILTELDMSLSIQELGAPLDLPTRVFAQWEVLGVYPFGTEGSKANYRPEDCVRLTRDLTKVVPGMSEWESTNTTPDGFMRVFMAKIDTAPCEKSDYHAPLFEIFKGMADYFEKVYEHEELSDEEAEKQCNKQGATTVYDTVSNLGEFLAQPDCWKKVRKLMKSLLDGKPSQGVFTTMGKREKKKSGLHKGSRMVAYLAGGMRICELKVFGKLLALTKPLINRYGVGGLGLHDLGMRIKEIWKGFGVSDDIAGWDTRVGLILLCMECYLIMRLCKTEELKAKVKAFYRLYAFPHMLIPRKSDDFVRCELVRGRGQVMSGRILTYSMNTITRIAVCLLQQAVAEGVDIKDMRRFAEMDMAGLSLDGSPSRWAGCTSGDDSFRTSTRRDISKFAATGNVLNNLGLVRKDVPYNARSPVVAHLEEIDFCSHNYERVTYHDCWSGRTVDRWQPTRSVGEIAAKAGIRLGGTKDFLTDMGWMSAQGNNLLVNYHHLRDIRKLGMAYKSVVPPNVVLVEDGGKMFARPWMREGEVLDVINECLFGESTAYPVPFFAVRKFGHLGYLAMEREYIYNPSFDHPTMRLWRKYLHVTVGRLAVVNGGDPTFLRNIGRYAETV